MAKSKNGNPIIKANPAKKLITEVTPHDVLLGRGSGPNEHPGNKAFRLFVERNKVKYNKTRVRRIKNEIALGTVRSVVRKSGRFLQRVQREGHNDDKGVAVYQVAHPDVVMEKTKQALRQKIQDKPSKPASGTQQQDDNDESGDIDDDDDGDDDNGDKEVDETHDNGKSAEARGAKKDSDSKQQKTIKSQK